MHAIMIIYRVNEELSTDVSKLREQIRKMTEDYNKLQKKYDDERKYREELQKELKEKEKELEELAKLNREYYEQSLRAEFREESSTPEGEEEEEGPADEVSNTADSLSALSTNEKPSEGDPSVPTSPQDYTIPAVVEAAGKLQEDNAE